MKGILPLGARLLNHNSIFGIQVQEPRCCPLPRPILHWHRSADSVRILTLNNEIINGSVKSNAALLLLHQWLWWVPSVVIWATRIASEGHIFTWLSICFDSVQKGHPRNCTWLSSSLGHDVRSIFMLWEVPQTDAVGSRRIQCLRILFLPCESGMSYWYVEH